MSVVSASDRARATREALVRTAGEMIGTSGYGAVSLRELARSNDVTTGAVYGHFRNKADLLAAAIADRIATDLEGPSRGSAGLTEALARQARAYRSRAGLRALLVEGAHAARVDDEARATLCEVYEARLAEWRSIYRGVQADEDAFPGVDMDTLVTMLWAMELGLGILEAAGVDLPTPGEWSATMRSLLSGIE